MNSLEEVQRAAAAGDPQAQDLLASVLDHLGRPEEAVHWLGRAAAGGHAGAAARLGLRELTGDGTPANPSAGLERILAGAAKGHPEAAHFAAVLHAGGVAAPRDVRAALDFLVAGARAGDPRAACQLGLLAGAGTTLGQALLRQAARAGFDPAEYALGAALLEAGEDAQGRAWLSAAAAAGNPCAIKVMGAGPTTPREDPQAVIPWDRVAEAIDLSSWSAPFERRLEQESPHIEVIPALIPRWACDYAVGMAAPVLQRGKVVDETGGESVRQVRTNAVMHFGLADSDVVLELISNRTAEAAGMPPETAEGLGVLHYQPGEIYAQHVDYIDPGQPQNAAHLALRGQRSRTLLVYLNDDFEGGETHFIRLDRRYRLPPGDALLFENVRPDGAPEPFTLHAGLPPTRGDKWLISKWFRTKALRPPPVRSGQ